VNKSNGIGGRALSDRGRAEREACWRRR